MKCPLYRARKRVRLFRRLRPRIADGPAVTQARAVPTFCDKTRRKSSWAATGQVEGSGVEWRLDVGGAVAVEAGRGHGLGEDDADGNEDGAGAGSERHGDFGARAFGILIAAAEADSAFRQIFADGDFFLEAAAANAREDAGLDARAVAAGNHAIFDRRLSSPVVGGARFGERFDPDGRGIAMLADARDAFADFEGFQLQLVEIDDFAALAKTAFHQEAGEGFFALVQRRKFDVPEVGAGIENVDGVNKVVRRVLVDFRDDAGAGALPVVAILVAAEVQLLAGGKFFVQAHDAAIAADEQCFGGVLDDG